MSGGSNTTERVATLEAHALTLLLVSATGTKTLPVTRGTVLTIGRAWPSDIVFDDASLSRSHARIEVLEADCIVEDLGSTNGTWARTGRVSKARFAFGDFVRLGDVHISVRAPHAVHASRMTRWMSFDDFESWARSEVARARTFGRSSALVEWLVPPETATGFIEQTLREVDALSQYADRRLWVGLCEANASQVEAYVQRVGALIPGIAARSVLFPADGASSDELFDALRTGERRSMPPEHAFYFGPELSALRQNIARVAVSQLPILLYGETGVGKEVFAREVHVNSSRAQGPFVAINCAAIPAGLLESTLFGHERGAFTGADRQSRGVFELANGGTLFLDEVGELPPAAQAALLRVLETGCVRRVGAERDLSVDVRIVAATHRELHPRAENQFRQDLLFRLDGVSFEIPPLRMREGDIEALSNLFVEQANRENQRAVAGIASDALAILKAYSWPGNLRELRNVIHRGVVITQNRLLLPEDLPERLRVRLPAPTSAPISSGALSSPISSSAPLPVDFRAHVEQATAELERRILVEALERAGGNQTAAANSLQMPIRTFTHKLKQLGIKRSFG